MTISDTGAVVVRLTSTRLVSIPFTKVTAYVTVSNPFNTCLSNNSFAGWDRVIEFFDCCEANLVFGSCFDFTSVTCVPTLTISDTGAIGFAADFHSVCFDAVHIGYVIVYSVGFLACLNNNAFAGWNRCRILRLLRR